MQIKTRSTLPAGAFFIQVVVLLDLVVLVCVLTIMTSRVGMAYGYEVKAPSSHFLMNIVGDVEFISVTAGDQPAFTVVPFEGDQAASYGEDLRAAITAMREECDGVLVFTDLLGGTPFNQAMMIAQDVDNVEVLTGTNLPMVIELLFLRGNATLAELGEQAVTVGQTGITAQTVASVAGSDEEDIFGDEDGI